jgi:hypothetical protein
MIRTWWTILQKKDASSWGKESPNAILHKKNGKVFFLPTLDSSGNKSGIRQEPEKNPCLYGSCGIKVWLSTLGVVGWTMSLIEIAAFATRRLMKQFSTDFGHVPLCKEFGIGRPLWSTNFVLVGHTLAHGMHSKWSRSSFLNSPRFVFRSSKPSGHFWKVCASRRFGSNGMIIFLLELLGLMIRLSPIFGTRWLSMVSLPRRRFSKRARRRWNKSRGYSRSLTILGLPGKSSATGKETMCYGDNTYLVKVLLFIVLVLISLFLLSQFALAGHGPPFRPSCTLVLINLQGASCSLCFKINK